MKKRMMLLLLACLMLVLSACAGKKSKMTQILARNDGAGELRVGVKIDVPNFGYLDPETGDLEGLEIDLAREMAEAILDDRNAVQFVPTTGMAKEALLANGEADLIIGTYTITDERRKVVHFSRPYYTDEIGFLVLSNSGMQSISDLKGKTIGVTRASTAFATFDKHPELIGNDFTLRGFVSYPEIQYALLSGTIDVFSADKSILSGYNTANTVILADGVQPQPYGIGSIISDKTFADAVDQILADLIESGTMDDILAKWMKE